ncbi:hypothetical protein K490DRAFT_2444, partial [Saccharata proteae CBS 121410]
MPTFHPSLLPHHTTFFLSTPLFFTATAPSNGHHINLSPKGLPRTSLAVLSPNQVAYLDHTGSGCETIAHIYDNGRVTLMACSFGASPKIMRLFCRGRVVEKTGNEGEFGEWVQRMRKAGLGRGEGGGEMEFDWKKETESVRAVVLLDVWKVQTSCGYGVPVINDNTNNNPKLETSISEPGGKVLLEYQTANNSRSLDGCPGLKSARRAGGEWVRMKDAVRMVKRAMGRLS